MGVAKMRKEKMKKLVLGLVVAGGLLAGDTPYPICGQQHPPPPPWCSEPPASRKLWLASAFTLTGAALADSWSSRGLIELNPIVARQNRFTVSSGELKLALVGFAFAAEWFVTRRRPQAAKGYARLNFGLAGGLAVVTVHNERQK